MGLLLICLLMPASEKPAPPVAMVLRSAPGATVQRGKDAAKALRDLDLLCAGDVVQSGKEAVRLVVLADGHGESIRAGQKVTLGKEGCSPAASVEQVKRKLGPAARKSLLRKMTQSGKAGGAVLRGREGEPGMISPAPGGYVLQGKPSFRWPAVNGAMGYEVRLYSGENPNLKLEWKRSTKETSIAYPETLPDGAVRTWEVMVLPAVREKFAVRDCRFDVPTPADRKRLDEATQLANSPDFEDRLLAAVLYEDFGAYDTAFSLYQKASKERPDQPGVLLALHRHHSRVGDKAGAAALEKRLKELGVTVKPVK